MAGSRSSPMIRPVGPTCRARAAAWPPAPTVPSTRTAPSWGFSQPITSSSRTGRCTFQPASVSIRFRRSTPRERVVARHHARQEQRRLYPNRYGCQGRPRRSWRRSRNVPSRLCIGLTGRRLGSFAPSRFFIRGTMIDPRPKVPAQTSSICRSRKWHTGLGFARFTRQGGPRKDLPHMPKNEEPKGPALDAGRNSDPAARPGLIRRDRGADGELASRGERARVEVPLSGSPRLWRGIVTLVLVLMVVFSAIPLTIDLLDKPNKDYSLWYQVGVVIRQGMNIYPDPATGRLFPFMYPPSAAAILGFLSVLGKHATTLVLVLAHSAAWIGATALSVWLATGGKGMRQHPLLAAAPSLCIIALIHNTYLLGQPNLTLLMLLLAAFACLRLGREAPAGVFVATAAAIKAFPILALGYFVYRRMWRASIATVAALMVWLLVVPLPFRSPAQAMADLAVWSRGMVF